MTTEPSDGSVELQDKQKKHLPLWQETILLLVVALGLAILIKAILVQAFYIPSESMEPGLVRNDRILVEKVSYWFGGSPERGDVVVFKDPGGWLSGAESVGPPGTPSPVPRAWPRRRCRRPRSSRSQCRSAAIRPRGAP